MAAFDQFDAQLNALQDKFFANEIQLAGQPVDGIFEEFAAEFAHVHDAVAMVEMPAENLPPNVQRGSPCHANDRSWRVKYHRTNNGRAYVYLE